MKAEDFINNSHFVSSDFIETEENLLGANMDKVFAFAEAYYKAKVESELADDLIHNLEKASYLKEYIDGVLNATRILIESINV